MNANSDIDLISLVENDLGQGRKSGRWMQFHCPFPGHSRGDKNPSLAVTNGDMSRPPFWKCWSCGKQGGAVKWLMEYRSIEYAEALEALNLKPEPNRARQGPPVQRPESPPAAAWQARAWALVERAEAALWDERGKDALTWLHGRGLNDLSIAGARIGYIPKKFIDRAEAWGTPNGQKDVMTFPAGILLPCVIGATIWYLKIRPDHPQPKQKYKHVRGGKQALFLGDTLAPDIPAVICEGEFDALLLAQEARHSASVITLASASTDINLATWGLYLMRPPSFILAFDMDKAGDEGANKFSWLHNSTRLQIPALREGDKDITDYYKSGGDLRALIQDVMTVAA
jgi:DNA primase